MIHLLAQVPEPPRVSGETAQLLLWIVVVLGIVVAGLAALLRHYAGLYRAELLANKAAEIARESALARATATLEARDAKIADQATIITQLRAELAEAKQRRTHG